MTEQSVIQTSGAAQVPTEHPAAGLRDYFKQCRANAVRKYRLAQFWVTRKSARAEALHYGRLVRMLEGRG